MDALSLRHSIVSEYRKVATSFTTIHAGGHPHAPHLDAFDRGLITVTNDGVIVVSEALDAVPVRCSRSIGRYAYADSRSSTVYLPWHRDRVFKYGGQHG